MKKLLLVLAFLSARWASAQTTCLLPQLKAFHDQQQIQTAGSAFTPLITLALVSDPSCPPAVSYAVEEAEVTLIRGRRPVLPARTFQGNTIDLSDFAQYAKPGDRFYLEARKVVGMPAGGSSQTDQLNSAEPIALVWVLTE